MTQYFNRQCVWGSGNHDITEYECDSLKISMWCALLKNEVTECFFLKEPMETDNSFLAMKENNALCHVLVGTIYQLDGEPSHFSQHICAFLDREFPDYWIRRGGPISWPPLLSRFDPLDFIGWGEWDF